jgi:hypothetical protein
MGAEPKPTAGSAGGPTAPEESLCRRCGRCCCRKFILKDLVYYTPFFCKFLDLRTRLCTVYAERFAANPHCLGVERGIARGVFPGDCPYVAGRPGYRPPVEGLDFFGLGELAREIAGELEVSDEDFERAERGQGGSSGGGER